MEQVARPGWGLMPGSQWWYFDVKLGQTVLRLDLWHLDNNPTRWAISLQNGPTETITQPSLERAQRAAEVILANQLRAAAKQLGKRGV